MTLSRRAILQGTALAAASGLVPLPGLRRLVFAAEAGAERILVVLHLRGGCDGLNLLSPAADPDFIAARSSELRVLADGPEAGRAFSVVRDDRAGVAVQNGDAAGLASAILSLAEHPEQRRAMGARGRALFDARFRRELAVERHHQLILRAARGPLGAPC